MSHLFKSCVTSRGAPAPNPLKFEIERAEVVGWYYVTLIRYPNCLNFEGKKVLILRKDPRKMVELDPHFSEFGPVVARFEPTDAGWVFAMKAARLLS